MDEMHSEGLITSKLRPKPEDCYVDAKNITAFWNKVFKAIYKLKDKSCKPSMLKI